MPIPPIEIQKTIVSEIEIFENNINSYASKIVELSHKAYAIITNISGTEKTLSKVVDKITERISKDDVKPEHYVNTDIMLKNCKGITAYNGIVPSGNLVRYQKGDILMSNIRPYLKKVWYSEHDGGCSPDVHVFRVKDAVQVDSCFIYLLMKQDAFFDYVMKDIKGQKIPRGKKEHILNYKVTIPRIEKQRKIVAQIEALENEIKTLESEISAAEEHKKTILNKYLFE